MKNRKSLIRLITFILSMGIAALIMHSFYFWMNQPSIGFDLDFKTGEFIQIYISSPNSETLSLSDKVLEIDGQPVNTYTAQEIDLQEELDFLVQDVDGEKRILRLSPHPLDTYGVIEHSIFPLLSLLSISLGAYLIFERDPEANSVIYFFMMFFGSIIYSTGALSRYAGGWFTLLYELSLGVISLTVIEFHRSILAVQLSNRIMFYVRLVFAGFVVFFFLNSTNVLPLLVYQNLTIQYGLLIYSFVFVLFTSVYQSVESQLSHGKLRILLVSYVVGAALLIYYSVFPMLLNMPRKVPTIIALLPMSIISISYFLLIRQQRRWINHLYSIEAFILSSIILYELYNLIWIPFSSLFPHFLFTPHSWILFIVYLFFFVLCIVVYHVVLNSIKIFIYGNAEYETRNMQRVTRNVLRKQDEETVLMQTGRVFQKFYRFDYLNICLRNGKVINFVYGKPPKPIIMKSRDIEEVLHQIESENLETSVKFQISIPPVNEKLKDISKQKSMLFGNNLRYCFLLNGQVSPVGMICAGPRQLAEPIDPIEIQQLYMLLDQYQVIVENVLLLEESMRNSAQVRKLSHQLLEARENERKRIARDMHDNIIQSVTAFRYSLNDLYNNDKMLISDDEADKLQLDLHEISQGMRNLCFDLRPPALDAIGLRSAIISLVESYHSKGIINIDLQMEGVEIIDQLSEGVAICLYRVLQEALSNIMRHAEASESKVSLNGVETELSLIVSDDGKGFNMPVQLNDMVSEDHYGLIGLQEFLDTVNGYLEIYTSPGEGSHIIATIPLKVKEGIDGLFYDHC
ncbi:MAG: sensor histidine kinase [Anaerolineaceae bacterium]|nr:sensor histidine kinase [Anaerolineaceae bacterium]